MPLLRLSILLSAVLLVGCAKRTLTLNSEPPGAIVWLNGEEVGRTPMRTDFRSYGDYDVVLRKEGFETLKTHLDVKTPWYMVPPIDLFSELFGVKDAREHTFSLAPQDAQAPADPQELVQRGIDLRGDLRSSRYTRQPSTFPATLPATQPSAPPSAEPSAPPAE